MSPPPLELTPIGKVATNARKSHLDSTHVGAKTLDPKPLKLPIDSSKRNGKEHVPEDPESDRSSSDSSSVISNSSDDNKYIKSKSKRHDKKKNHRKRMKQDSSKSSTRDSDSSKKSDYKNQETQEKEEPLKHYHFKLCTKLTSKFLTKAYKSKINILKLDEYPLQHRINLLTFMESLKIMFSQYE